MKSLVMQTILVILAVTATTAWAWAQTEPADTAKAATAKACAEWNKDEVCNPTDPTLQAGKVPASETQAGSPECKYADKRCFKNQSQARMRDATAAPVGTASGSGATENKGNRDR